MKHFYKSLLIIFSLPVFSYAQSNFKPGYVVTLNRDTLRGLIDYKEWGMNPKQFRFKKSEGLNGVEQYSTANTLAFAVNGLEYYQRGIVWISQDALDLANLSTSIDSVKKLDTVFLRALVVGKNLTLFAYKDIIKERYFISNAGAPAVELIYRRYLSPNEISGVITQDTYIRQLQKLAALYQPNSTSLTSEIQNSTYSEEALIKVAVKINGPANIQNSVDARYTTRFFIGAGINFVTNKAKGDIAFANSKSTPSFFPLLNIGMDFYFNKNVGQFLLRAELQFTGDKTNFRYNGFASTPYVQTLSFNQYTTSFNPQLLYNIYNTDQTKLYLAAGIAADYSIYSNKQNNIVYSVDGKPIGSNNLDFPNVQAIYFNFTSKIGMSLNHKFEIYFGYNPPSSVTNNLYYTLSSASYRAGITFLFD